MARRCRSACSMPRASSGTSTFSSTVSQGNSAKLWNTMATLGAHSASGLPCQRTSPAEGWRQPREHAQQRGLAGAGRAQQSDDDAGLDGQVGGRDHLNRAAVRPLEALFDPARLDDRRFRRGRAGSPVRPFPAAAAAPVSRGVRQLVHQALPGFLGQFVDELHARVGVHLVDDGIQFVDRPRMQQNVGVVVREGSPTSLAAKSIGIWRKSDLLLFEGDGHEQVRGHRRIEALELRQRAIPVPLGE